jgi:hypothetical protein
MDDGDKEGFTKLISIIIVKPLIEIVNMWLAED